MHLSPHEQARARLLLSYAAELARRRRARGLRLNLPEATAVISDHVLAGARGGVLVAELMQSGRTVLTRDDVMDGVPELLEEVQVEATFPDGTKLVTVHHPIPDPRGGDPGLRRDRDAARRTADRARGDALDLCLEPTVVAAGAHRRADLRVQLGPDARLTVLEQVLLVRSGEDPGRWAGTTRIERSGIPLLHTTVGLGPEEPAWLPPVAPRAYASAVHIGDEKTEVASGDDAVRLPLPGGWVTTAWGAELRRVAAAAETLARA